MSKKKPSRKPAKKPASGTIKLPELDISAPSSEHIIQLDTPEIYVCKKHGETEEMNMVFGENHCYNRNYCLKCLINFLDDNGVCQVEASSPGEIEAAS